MGCGRTGSGEDWGIELGEKRRGVWGGQGASRKLPGALVVVNISADLTDGLGIAVAIKVIVLDL